MDNIIDIIGVSSGYRGSFVLKNINFKVKSGEFIGLIGPNGAGKSTLLKTLAGLIKPFQGKIILKKFDFQKMDLKEKAKHIAVLPQIFKAQFSYTVEEFIMMGRFPYLEGLGKYCREDIESALKLMEKLGLVAIKHKRINEISGGELQKVLFAQVLAQGSEIVLLDEPTAHLDIGHQVEIMGMLSGLNRDGLTVI
ncbi:MAG: ABC transporter ATP-binding protein, partial [Candidatus Omnitrophica bacterium]|nr:ABC transporter ATP-binding protein [Candidatus Omnitrophota bacterium]